MDLEFISTILTPIENWETLGLEFGWKMQNDPYAVKIKVMKGRTEFSFKGRISIAQGEFSIMADSPFEGYESISLSGKLGKVQKIRMVLKGYFY